jgi:hypothetical protein
MKNKKSQNFKANILIELVEIEVEENDDSLQIGILELKKGKVLDKQNLVTPLGLERIFAQALLKDLIQNKGQFIKNTLSNITGYLRSHVITELSAFVEDLPYDYWQRTHSIVSDCEEDPEEVYENASTDGYSDFLIPKYESIEEPLNPFQEYEFGPKIEINYEKAGVLNYLFMLEEEKLLEIISSYYIV